MSSGRFAGKYVSGVVSNARGGIIAHTASAERMYSNEAIVQHLIPCCIGNVCSTKCSGCIIHSLTGLFKDGLFAYALPANVQVIILVERHFTSTVIMTHNEVRLGIVCGAAIRSPDKA